MQFNKLVKFTLLIFSLASAPINGMNVSKRTLIRKFKLKFKLNEKVKISSIRQADFSEIQSAKKLDAQSVQISLPRALLPQTNVDNVFAWLAVRSSRNVQYRGSGLRLRKSQKFSRFARTF